MTKEKEGDENNNVHFLHVNNVKKQYLLGQQSFLLKKRRNKRGTEKPGIRSGGTDLRNDYGKRRNK